MKGMNKNAIRSNPDSALAAIRQMLKSTDSIKNRITHEALKTVPQGAQAEKYLNTKSKTDTTYSIVQFQGSLDQTSSDQTLHIAANCFAQKAPLVQRGSSFTVMLMANEQVDFEARMVNRNREMNNTVKYVVQRNNFDGHASLTSTSHSKEVGQYYDKLIDVTKTVNTEPKAQNKQFIFSFDTLTNIGQVSYLEVVEGHTKIDAGEHAGLTTSQIGVGISAITDPQNYDFNALEKDKASVELDKLTDGQLLAKKSAEDGDEIPLLVVEKTKYGFKLTCHAVITKGGETTTTNITAYIGRTISNYEAIIKPVEKNKFKYEEWVPEGPKVDGSDDTKGDDRLQFNVIVRDKKDHSKMYNGNFTVEWRLEDVTKYPGFCNNYPSYDKSSDINFDLKFDPSLGKDPNFDEGRTDGTVATTKDNKGKDATVHVMSMDYAAWGKLKARITLDDGSFPIIANPYYKEDADYLTIPYDIDENKLADKWETDNHVFKKGFALTWDEDSEPKEQNGNGDGYSMFEEYRGFAVHNPKPKAGEKEDTHLRTNIQEKDIFVYDRDKLFQKYYEPYNPSKLFWHYVSDEKKQFVNKEPDIIDPMHRLVNFNKVAEYTYDDQFCLALYKEPGLSYDGKAAGITFTRSEYATSLVGIVCDEGVEKVKNNDKLTPDEKRKASDKLINDYNAQREKNIAKYNPKDGDSPLKIFIKVSIFPKKIELTYAHRSNPQAIFEGVLHTTVIHEVGHNIGIAHHKAPEGAIHANGVTQKEPAFSDGVLDCSMRYPNVIEDRDDALLATHFTTYCKKNAIGLALTYTYPNCCKLDDDGNFETNDIVPKITSTPAPSDNCFGQIKLKGKK